MGAVAKLAAAEADVLEWERKSVEAEKRGDENALRHCLRKWDEAMDRRDAARAATPKGGAK